VTRRYILTIDGGGIRGIIPLTLLVALERNTARPVRETFSFVAGASTGAVIAVLLAAGMPATRVLDLYLNRAGDAFTQRPWSQLARLFTGALYSTQRLHDLIARELGPAGGWTLDDAPIDLLITATGLRDGMPWYVVRDSPANARRTGRLRLADCATASSAAPTYVQPWTVREGPATRPPGAAPIGPLVDGGAGVAGNPVYQACVEAFYYTEAGRYRPEETTVVSLGTGRYIAPDRPRWLGAWLSWVLDQLLRSPGEQQTALVQRHFSQAALYRLDLRLLRNIGLDDSGSARELHGLGEALAARISWLAILDGTDTTFRVGQHKTLWTQYSCQPLV